MKRVPNRITIYARDIENITGRRRRTSYVLLQKVRMHFNKDRKGLITMMEFCSFMKMEEQEVREFLE